MSLLSEIHLLQFLIASEIMPLLLEVSVSVATSKSGS